MTGPLYGRFERAYLCSFCKRAFGSHQALNYHLFRAKNPCVSNHNRIKYNEGREQITEFIGERMEALSAPVALDAHPESRDAQGRLRISGMLTGYRGWSIGRIENRYCIFPVFQQSSVPYSKGVMTAHCPSRHSHLAPDADCSCGFYAAWTTSHSYLFTGSANRSIVHGRVKGFGKVLPGELGWRAQHTMVDGFYMPSCGATQCENEAKKCIVRPDWIKPIAPSGRCFPTVSSSKYDTYREGADFVASNSSSVYLGWYCDQHGAPRLMKPRYEFQCNYPAKTICKRPSTFVLENLPYSWCNEHAPMLLDAKEIMDSLCDYYDVYLLDKEVA